MTLVIEDTDDPNDPVDSDDSDDSNDHDEEDEEDDQATGMLQVSFVSFSKMLSFFLVYFHPSSGGWWGSSPKLAFKSLLSIPFLTNQ